MAERTIGSQDTLQRLCESSFLHRCFSVSVDEHDVDQR